MMMKNRYIEEAKILEKKWAETGLLDGIKDMKNRKITAVMLESQRLMNEMAPANYWLSIAKEKGL